MVTPTSTRWTRGALLPALVAGCAALLPFASAPAAGAAVPACTTSGLVVWLDTQPGGAAAGSTYVNLDFTNLSGHACSLGGYPGVSAVSLAGRQLGRAATRDRTTRPRTVVLGADQSAETTLQISQALNYPRAKCLPVMAAGVRVFPPNQTAARLVPYPFMACSRLGPVILSVRPLKKP